MGHSHQTCFGHQVCLSAEIWTLDQTLVKLPWRFQALAAHWLLSALLCSCKLESCWLYLLWCVGEIVLTPFLREEVHLQTKSVQSVHQDYILLKYAVLVRSGRPPTYWQEASLEIPAESSPKGPACRECPIAVLGNWKWI